MQTFIAVCLGLLTLEAAIALAFFIAMTIAIRQAVRAFEMLAYRMDEEVEHVGATMRSGWMRTLQAAAGVVSSFWFGRHRDD